VLDGLEATAQIRRRMGARAPPIIALTANAMPEQRAQALAAGMLAHVAKPIDVARMYQLLQGLRAQ
jgi:CheY-like chemotaxis protein